MKAAFKITFVVLIILATVALAAYYVSINSFPVLNPAGMIGIKERDLIVTASLLMLIVVIPVFIFAWTFAWRYREKGGKGRHTPDWSHNNIAEYCWWGVPLIIILIMSIFTWRSSHQLNPFKPLDIDKKPVNVQVVALQWKWLFIYPDLGIATVNYLQIPEKTPINFEITADAPMNSFWIPALGGQIYAMPSKRSRLHLIANKSGSFRGGSSNYSGKGFAGMRFQVEATSERAFRDWARNTKNSDLNLTLPEYQKLVEPSSYHPVTLYNLEDTNLFYQILRKYLVPQKGD